MSFPTEVEGMSKGWMRGGTGVERGRAKGNEEAAAVVEERRPSGAMLGGMEGYWPVEPPPLSATPPFQTPHPLQPIIAALVRVQLAGGSRCVAIAMEVGVGVLQLRHLGDLI